MANTGQKFPTTNYAVNDIWSNRAGAYTEDGTFTQSYNGSNDTDDWGGFNFNIPEGSTITGIAVVLKGYSNLSSKSVYTEVSWNGGTNYTGLYNTASFSTSNNNAAVSSSAYLWGRTWTVDELSDANFRINLKNAYSSSTWLYVDAIKVTVYYSEPLLANVAKYMGVDKANISKINGVSLASIKSINGVS